MKLEIEVYDLGERLYHMKDNEIKEFIPRRLDIVSEYAGYSGDYWGDIRCGRGGGYPIKIIYSNGEDGTKEIKEKHGNLFKTKEELVEHLMKKK
jgi:hypothetical protein